MGIFIQKIETNWTKKSRGNPGSTLRNRVPEKLPIRIFESSESALLQYMIFNEGSFEKPSKNKTYIINDNSIRQHGLDFKHVAGGLEVGLWTRHKNLQKIGVLKFNSWCQIKTNCRYPMEYTTGYRKIVFNIFYGEMEKAKDIVKSKNHAIEKDFQTLLL
jgi:hypothetical protein